MKANKMEKQPTVLTSLSTISKFRPGLDLPSFAAEKTIFPKRIAVKPSRRFAHQPKSTLKQQYSQKLSYINSPINQVQVPGISSSKLDF